MNHFDTILAINYLRSWCENEVEFAAYTKAEDCYDPEFPHNDDILIVPCSYL